jgi:hypothetical protein
LARPAARFAARKKLLSLQLVGERSETKIRSLRGKPPHPRRMVFCWPNPGLRSDVIERFFAIIHTTKGF